MQHQVNVVNNLINASTIFHLIQRQFHVSYQTKKNTEQKLWLWLGYGTLIIRVMIE